MTWHSEINGKLNDKFWLYRFVVKILINKCLCFADLSVTVSKKNKRNIQSLFSDDVSNMHVIPNPVFDSNLLNDLVVEKIIDKCFIDSLTLGTPRIISVGRLDKVKRHDFLLKAACSLIYNNCCELFIIGTGPEESNLRSLSKKLNIESGVHFLGFQNNPYKYLANSSVFVLTSRRESFGNVLVEAMACGLTPVSVDCPYGPAEILAQGKYGYLVENDSVESLRKSISKALTNPIDSQKLKKRASEYSINKISKSYEYIFLQILK
jgi:glycosyltransferase involved in cell wall biosynthesis